MSLADDIREYVLIAYIKPARRKGDPTVEVRVGDVHRAMGLKSRQPAIAGALGAQKFEQYANVRLISREGPHMGSNLLFTFEV